MSVDAIRDSKSSLTSYHVYHENSYYEYNHYQHVWCVCVIQHVIYPSHGR